MRAGLTLLPFAALASIACGGDDRLTPHAVAATPPPPSGAGHDADDALEDAGTTHGVDGAPADDANGARNTADAPDGGDAGGVLVLDAVAGVEGADGGVVVPDAPGPSTRVPKCFASGACKGAWIESRDGFVTRWAVRELDAKAKKERDPAALVGEGMKPLAVPGPVVKLAPEGKEDKGRGAWVLAARVFSDEARSARLMVSLNGLGRVSLNGQVVHEEAGDQYLLVDHRTVPVSLVAGWNTLAVRLEKLSPYAVMIALRLRGLDGAALPLAWALPDGVAAPGPCDTFDAAITPTLTADGWRVEGRLAAHGALPWPTPAKVALTIDGASPSEAPLDIDRLPLALVYTVPAGTADGQRTATLSVDGATCATLALKAVPARERWAAASALLAKIDPAVLGPGDRESLEYQAEDARRVIERAAGGDNVRRLEGTLAHFEAHVRSAAAGGRPFETPGLHVRAYRSDYDGTLQRYLVVVPKGLGKGDPAPLVLLAHGLEYTPEDMLRIALAKPSGPGEALRSGVIYKWDPPEPPNGAILVAHDGYGNAGQRAPGEVDVRRVIDEVKAAYPVDPRRVSISGFSLGGSVAFWVPFHAPSVFSAAAPLCGYPNILEYRSVKAATKKPWEAQLLDEDGVAPYAEGGKYLPLKMVHGAMDGPSRSELIHNRYKTLRYPSELDIPPLGHNVWDKAFEDGKLLKWLAARRRPAVAPQPVVRAGRYRWAESYWLRIDRFADEALFGQLDGTFKGDRIQVATRNVAAFSLLGRELGERAHKPQAIVIDGKNLGEHTVDAELHLSRAGGSWKVVPAIDRPTDGKRAGVEGPLGDVWFGPLVVVYGTQVPAEIEVNRLAAERLAMHAPWIDVRAPILADIAVGDEDLRGRSVILVGRPATNLVTRRAEAALRDGGITFEGDALVVGKQRFTGPEIGLSVIRPSPFDPDRYVVVHAGLGPDGTLSSRYLPEISPDLLVYDSRMRAVFGDRILGPRVPLLGALFDATWALPEELR